MKSQDKIRTLTSKTMTSLNIASSKIKSSDRVNSFECKINTSTWSGFRFATSKMDREPAVFAMYDEPNKVLEIYVINQKHAVYQKVIFQLNGISGVGSYAVKPSEDKVLVMAESEWLNANPEYGGTWIITNLDKQEKIIEGHFYFENANTNRKVSVTKGSFKTSYR